VSQKKRGVEKIRMAVTPFDPSCSKLHVACKLDGSMFYRSRVIADQSFTLREYGFLTFFAPVTLTLTG